MSRTRRTALAALALAASTSLLAGCSGAAQGASASGEPAEGGTLTYLEPQAWATLYPPAGGFYPNGGIVNNITDRLLYQNPDTLELEPWIAAELPVVNEDATEYTFTIRDDVTYSDGSKLTAENVVRNIELYALGDADRALAPSEAISHFDHGEVVDDHTVKFTFNAPAPGFSQAVSTINSGLVSDSTLALDSEGFGPGSATQVIGSGPFVVADEKIGTETALAVREDYDWAPDSAEHDGRAYLDGITYVVAAENSVRVGTVAAHQADIARQIPAPDEPQFDADGLSIVAAGTNGVNNSLNFRFTDPRLNDIRVRQAIIAGIDREAIVKTLFTESYPLAKGALATTAQGFVDTSDHYTHDPKRAKTLLSEAGWSAGSDGVLEKDGERLSLTFNEALPQPRSKEVVTLIQEQLATLGIEVKQYSGDQAAQTAAALDTDTIQVYHSMVGRADFDVLKSQFFSKNRNALNNGDAATDVVADTKLDALLDAVSATPDVEGRAAASAAAQHYLAEQAYILPLFEEPQVFGLTDAVHGFRTESVGRPTFYDTWLTR